MFDNLRKRLSAAAILAGLPAPIPVGTVTGRLVSDEPNFEEVPPVTQTTDVPVDQQVIVGMDFGTEPSRTHFIALEQDYSKIEARIAAQLDAHRLIALEHSDADVQRKVEAALANEPGIKLKPTSLSAEDAARLDAAQQKRDRKAAKRADDRVQTVWHHAQNSNHPPLGDRNAYAVR